MPNIEPMLLRLASTECGPYKFKLANNEPAYPDVIITVYSEGGWFVLGVIMPDGSSQDKKDPRQAFDTIEQAGRIFSNKRRNR